MKIEVSSVSEVIMLIDTVIKANRTEQQVVAHAALFASACDALSEFTDSFIELPFNASDVSPSEISDLGEIIGFVDLFLDYIKKEGDTEDGFFVEMFERLRNDIATVRQHLIGNLDYKAGTFYASERNLNELVTASHGFIDKVDTSKPIEFVQVA